MVEKKTKKKIVKGSKTKSGLWKVDPNEKAAKKVVKKAVTKAIAQEEPIDKELDDKMAKRKAKAKKLYDKKIASIKTPPKYNIDLDDSNVDYKVVKPAIKSSTITKQTFIKKAPVKPKEYTVQSKYLTVESDLISLKDLKLPKDIKLEDLIINGNDISITYEIKTKNPKYEAELKAYDDKIEKSKTASRVKANKIKMLELELAKLKKEE